MEFVFTKKIIHLKRPEKGSKQMILTGGTLKGVTQSNAAYKLVAKDGIEPSGPKALGYEPRVLPLHTTSPNCVLKANCSFGALGVLPLDESDPECQIWESNPGHLLEMDNPNNAAFKTLT